MLPRVGFAIGAWRRSHRPSNRPVRVVAEHHRLVGVALLPLQRRADVRVRRLLRRRLPLKRPIQLRAPNQ